MAETLPKRTAKAQQRNDPTMLEFASRIAVKYLQR